MARHLAALPAPRRLADRAAARRSAGYASGGSGPAGFPLYQTEALRRTVFATLFRPFEGAILGPSEMQAPAYPFRSCPATRCGRQSGDDRNLLTGTSARFGAFQPLHAIERDPVPQLRSRSARSSTITFTTGRRYVYFQVPPAAYEDFSAAFSKGRHFNANIRDHYDFAEAPAQPADT